MYKSLLLAFFLLSGWIEAPAQWLKKPVFSGVYLQWGYNRDVYSKSDIHLKNGDKYDFTIHDATAKDKPDYSAFRNKPLDITIPQNSFRIGVYLDPKHSHAIELNFDHAKYVMEDNKVRRITGRIHGEPIDKDTLIPYNFVHLEHTNGANFYHINYVGQQELLHYKNRKIMTGLWKAGAGVVIPKSDITIMGNSLDNRYHIAGYIASLEGAVRYYPFRNLFLEAAVKGGFANYLNVLTVEGGKGRHHFFYGAALLLVGYDINYKKKEKK